MTVFDDGKNGFAEGVPYTWGLAGPDGAWFILKPHKGVHTKEDVDKAKAALRSSRDVVELDVEWRE